MGFTVWLVLIFCFLAALAAWSFQTGKRILGIVFGAVIVTGFLVLGYLWFTSPM